MQIPKILHQTWKNDELPQGFERLSNTWKENYPDWTYKLWTDADNRKFIEDHFPSFIEKYDGYSLNIQRVDAVRYLILYKYGGMFVDLDFECCKRMDEIFGDASCIFGKEPDEHCVIHEKEFIISNAIMAAIPGHPFMGEIYEELQRFSETIEHKNNKVLESTGPFMVTRMYARSANKENVKLLDYKQIYPLTKNEIDNLLKERLKTPEVANKIKEAFAIHYYSGTWWDANYNTSPPLISMS